jgi:aryl-alcohol dehydrogenase-like predicted oxidoreductase
MLWQAPEVEVFELCAANNISQIVWSPLAQGLLTGKYLPGQPPPADSRRAHDEMGESMGVLFDEAAAIEAAQRLIPIAEGAGLSMPTLALAWVLRRSELASAITGASRPGQVHANAAAAGVKLPDDVLKAVDDALGDVPVTTPTIAPFAKPGVLHR